MTKQEAVNLAIQEIKIWCENNYEENNLKFEFNLKSLVIFHMKRYLSHTSLRWRRLHEILNGKCFHSYITGNELNIKFIPLYNSDQQETEELNKMIQNAIKLHNGIILKNKKKVLDLPLVDLTTINNFKF